MDSDILHQPDQQRCLRDLIAMLRRALARAHRDVAPLAWAELSSGTRWAVIHSFAMCEAEQHFECDPTIQVHQQSDGLRYIETPACLIRLKRAPKRTREIALNATRQTREWTCQTTLETFPDPRLRLHLVYDVDEMWLNFNYFAVGLYVVDEPVWMYDIDFDDGIDEVAASPISPPIWPADSVPPLRLKPVVEEARQLEIEGQDGATSQRNHSGSEG